MSDYLAGVRDGVAAYAQLCRDADARVAAGDPRTRGQLIADLLVERVTGRAPADGVRVEVTLVVSADTLLDHGTEPAHLDGIGPIPAPTARDLALTGIAPVWLRRIFTTPGSGELVGVESRRRLFTTAQRRWVRLRDQVCRTPWCEAPILPRRLRLRWRGHPHDTDHVQPHDRGGPTSVGNGQGLCQACNHAKQAPGWRASRGPLGSISTTTPTGHRYLSRPPCLPGTTRGSPLERALIDIVWAAAA